MGGVGEDVEAPGVMDVLIAGKPDVALFRNEADQQHDHRRDAQAEGGSQHEPVPKGIQHPNAFRRCFARRAEGEGRPPLQGIEEHPVEVPHGQSQGNIDGEFLFVTLKPGAALLSQFVFQFFQEL